MNAKELRQAAEITRHFIEREDDDLNVIAGHIENIAAHILSTVRDDDDEPVSKEWFEEVIGDPLDLQTIEPWFIWWHSTRELLMGPEGGSVGPEPLTLPIKTRGQFRSLCRGLGIELKEADRAE